MGSWCGLLSAIVNETKAQGHSGSHQIWLVALEVFWGRSVHFYSAPCCSLVVAELGGLAETPLITPTSVKRLIRGAKSIRGAADGHHGELSESG